MAASAYWRPFPRVVRVEPAGACNLRCSHCPTGTVDMVRGIMQPATFAVVLDNLKRQLESVKVVVLYHGGEPLLNKGFTEMARSIKDLGIAFVKTVANGMLLPDSQIEGIIDSGLDAIEFSLDGDSPELNDRVRRNCSYSTVVQNVKRLIDMKNAKQSAHPKVFISSTQFINQDTHTNGQTAPVPDFLRREFSGPYEGEIAAFKCTFAMRWPRMEVDAGLYEVYYDPFDQETTNYCDHVDNTLTVRWNGDIVACCYDLTSEYVLGNVLHDDLSTIWNNDKYLRLRESIDKKEFIDLCNNCNVVRPNVYLTLKAAQPAFLYRNS